MLALLLLLAVAAAPVAMDVDTSGLSVLERQALVGNAHAEIADGVDAPGLAACPDDACRAAVLKANAARAGAIVRIVRVLQVVRVDLATVDADGAILGRSTRSMDLDAAARGPLFDANALAFIAPLPAPPSEPPPATPPASPATTAAPTASTTSSTSSSTSSMSAPAADGPTARTISLGIAVGAGVFALAALAVAGNEAAVANSATSLGGEKERARVLGPIASVVCALGVLGAAGSAGYALFVAE